MAHEKAPSRMDLWVDKYTPDFLKRAASWVVDRLPERQANWIRQNKAKSIMIFFIVRGLFFRPTMWVLYISIFSYFMS